ncbi:glycosyl transferase family 90 [Prochlorococcus marinus]|uniref:glycosyl transferase family 90 n=1 Tax=Prochlorococcus marinus TaxID=1219 RepID=UPI0022B46B2C|nr:glycosyl transferase family 90 [Prochlorococcus marinus]
MHYPISIQIPVIDIQLKELVIALKFKVYQWLIKESKMYWRGSTTGDSYKNLKELNKLKRIEICKRFRESKGIDIKLSRITQTDTNKEKTKKYLIQEKIFRKEVSENKFINYKYYPDIPVNSLAWESIRKYLMGNLIFKSTKKRQLYYYRFLKPWKNYIPVEENFLDLEEKYSWVKSHREEAAFIAWNGYIQSNNYVQNAPEYLISRILERTN